MHPKRERKTHNNHIWSKVAMVKSESSHFFLDRFCKVQYG